MIAYQSLALITSINPWTVQIRKRSTNPISLYDSIKYQEKKTLYVNLEFFEALLSLDPVKNWRILSITQIAYLQFFFFRTSSLLILLLIQMTLLPYELRDFFVNLYL